MCARVPDGSVCRTQCRVSTPTPKVGFRGINPVTLAIPLLARGSTQVSPGLLRTTPSNCEKQSYHSDLEEYLSFRNRGLSIIEQKVTLRSRQVYQLNLLKFGSFKPFRCDSEGQWVLYRYHESAEVFLESIDFRCPISALCEDVSFTTADINI